MARRILDDLREFHVTPAPAEPPEFRLAAQLVKGLTYLSGAFPLVFPALLVAAVLLGRLEIDALSGNWLVLLAILGAIPTFAILAMAYPAFVRGERWALLLITLVGVGLLVLAPARFLTEAASSTKLAVPPTRVEWGIFIAAALFLYFVLAPETRAGMRAARARNAVRPARGARLTVPLAAGGAAARPVAAEVRYTCPECARSFTLRKAPPPGTLCPACRAK